MALVASWDSQRNECVCVCERAFLPDPSVPTYLKHPFVPSPYFRRTQIFLRCGQGRAVDEVAPRARLNFVRTTHAPTPIRSRQTALPQTSEGAAGAAGRKDRQSVMTLYFTPKQLARLYPSASAL